MYPSRNELFLPGPRRLGPVILGVLSLGLWSCGFMDLRPIGLKTVPPEAGTVLPDYYSPVILRFDTAMEKPETERIIQITSSGGPAEGDLQWDGDDLYFVPVGGWKAGTRYTLALSGTVYSSDGRELRLSNYIPFFAVLVSPAPRVEFSSPADGASVGVSSPEGVVLELRFSGPMDRRSTETALSLDCPGNKFFEWLDDDRTLRIRSSATLSPWTAYRWNLGAQAQSREGVPVATVFSGQFITGQDRLIPQVLKVFPVRFFNGDWRPLGDSLETGPGAGEGIGIEFNKPMDGDSLLRALRFEPSLPGRVEQTGPAAMVFIPEKDPEPETLYTLRLSGDTKDTGGLKTGADYTVCFTPDIPFLKIVSLSPDGAQVLAMDEPGGSPPGSPPSPGTAYPVPVDIPGGGVLRLGLKFSLPFSPEARLDAALGITVDTFFPGTLPPVSLRFAYWFSDDATLRMEWEGLEPGTGGEPHYYRLAIPGGRNGIGTGSGSYLKESRYVYLEAVKK